MANMFDQCSSLISLPKIDKWIFYVMDQHIRVYDIFKDCSSLIWIPKLNNFSKELWLSDDENDNRQYSRFDYEHKIFY